MYRAVRADSEMEVKVGGKVGCAGGTVHVQTRVKKIGSYVTPPPRQ